MTEPPDSNRKTKENPGTEAGGEAPEDRSEAQGGGATESRDPPETKASSESRDAAESEEERTSVFGLIWETFRNWLEDDVIHWGASLAYYSLVSLAPLVVLAMTILGKVVGSGEAEEWVLDQVRLLSGPRGMDLAQTVIQEANRPDLGSVGAVLTILLLLFGATAIFTNLQGALNRIWGVQAATPLVRNVLRTRAAAFFMVLMLGGLLFVSVIVSTLVSWAGPVLDPLNPLFPVVQVADVVTSLLLLWLFVAATFQILPDVRISWRDVWVGALATAVLLVLGKYVLAWFLARNAFASMYGTAGSLFLLLMWVYFSAQVFFMGAEFTEVWARHRGRSIQPETYAHRTKTVPVDEE